MKLQAKVIDGLHVALRAPENWNGQTNIFIHGGPGGHSADFEAGLEHFDALMSHGHAWITYDQRGCGRSAITPAIELSHRRNIADLIGLISTVPSAIGVESKLMLYGHSYGARLAYDTLFTTPALNLVAILGGRSIHPLDAMNTSILMDVMILRSSDTAAFEKAQNVVAGHIGEPYETAKRVRECFTDPQFRQKMRQRFYWINECAMEWWNAAQSLSTLRDCDDVYFQVASTYDTEKFNNGVFDPSLLPQPCLLIQGFFDVLMNGTANPRIASQERAVRFNGSAHYPHFEQPDLFMKTVSEFIEGVKL